MRGIRRLAVCTAATGLLAAAAVSASMQVAHANTSDTCNGDAGSKYACNLTTSNTIPDPSSISVTLSDQDTETIGINWTISCTDNSGTGTEQGGVTTSVMPGSPVTEDLTPLPSTADGQCNVTAQVALPAGTDVLDYDFTAELDYTPASPTPGGTNVAVPLIKGYGGMCVDDKGNSSANRSKIEIWKCSSTDQAQSWKFTNDELVHNGKCINDQADGGSGTHVILYSCSGAANDKWSALTNGELKLKAHNGTLCLNDPGYSKKSGTQLIVYKCTDSSNEKWSLP
jgi:Ricin-type beta-trefoil lectin domain